MKSLKLALCTFTLCLPLCLGGVVSKKCRDVSERCYDSRLHPDTGVVDYNLAISKEANNKYWLDNAQNFVEQQLAKENNQNIAKNVIFFIGDGMSIPTLATARVYFGGEEKQLSFEKFPHIGMSTTYCIDRRVPDSACTSTAYLNGVKGNYGTIGVNARVKRADCSNIEDATTHTQSIAKWAMDAGKVAGLVTTTRVTHASPAGVYAHVPDRNWESDYKVPQGCPENIDIASQLVYGEVGSKLKVIFGGGRREFRNYTVKDEEGDFGSRNDGKDLIKEWLDAGKGRKYVYNKRDLMNIDTKNTDSVLGLFQSGHMLYHLEAEQSKLADEKPTLAEMTQKAIEILQKNDKGFFLFVEGGKIDLAHHDVLAKIALDETVELSKAVEIARELTDSKDTLIVVSSDHAHTMSYSGYPARHSNIFGASQFSKEDNLPYMTINYANGNGYDLYVDNSTNTRKNPATADTSDIMMKFPSTLPIDSETHGGEDVAVFAHGPWSHLFTGTYEQNVLPHLMAYAACIGDGIKACDQLTK